MLLALVWVAACSSAARVQTDGGDGSPDAADGGDVESDIDADGDAERHREIDGPGDVPGCGNGVLDPEEECDDENRLNGDGCDWLCRLGDGEPPREHDPVPEYALSDEITGYDEQLCSYLGISMKPPLVWTGSELATALAIVLETHYGDMAAELGLGIRRLDRAGEILQPDWMLDPGYQSTLNGAELVWTGSGFGLFFITYEVGISFVPLDAQGQPTAEPRLVVEDETVDSISADRTEEGFVLAWSTAYVSWIRFIGLDGSTDGMGEPQLIGEIGARGPHVVSGPGGIGVLVFEENPDWRSGTAHFYLVNHDLEVVATSNSLSVSEGSELVATGDRFAAVFSAPLPFTQAATPCLARFASDGMLEGPPVCRNHACFGPRLAAGDDGFLVLCSSTDGLLALQTDLEGSFAQVIHFDQHCLGYAAAWMGDGYGVITLDVPEDSPHIADMSYHRILRAE